MVLGGRCSTPWPLKNGVSQGYDHCFILFNVYMKPLVEVIRVLGLCCHQYVDDVPLIIIWPLLERRELATTVTHALVTSRFDY